MNVGRMRDTVQASHKRIGIDLGLGLTHRARTAEQQRDIRQGLPRGEKKTAYLKTVRHGKGAVSRCVEGHRHHQHDG